MDKMTQMVAPCGRYCGDCPMCGESVDLKTKMVEAIQNIQ